MSKSDLKITETDDKLQHRALTANCWTERSCIPAVLRGTPLLWHARSWRTLISWQMPRVSYWWNIKSVRKRSKTHPLKTFKGFGDNEANSGTAEVTEEAAQGAQQWGLKMRVRGLRWSERHSGGNPCRPCAGERWRTTSAVLVINPLLEEWTALFTDIKMMSFSNIYLQYEGHGKQFHNFYIICSVRVTEPWCPAWKHLNSLSFCIRLFRFSFNLSLTLPNGKSSFYHGCDYEVSQGGIKALFRKNPLCVQKSMGKRRSAQTESTQTDLHCIK